MRADRLMAELLLLQANRQMTGREMAKRLEVSERTVHRDMEALSTAGVPVFALRGAQGGWQLDENWRTKVPGLDEAELRALLMAQPRVIGDPRLAAAAERALGKLMAAMPVPLRDKAESIRQRLFVDTTGWWGTTENLAMLPIVQEAVWRDRKLMMRYAQAGKEATERTVDPLGLVAKGRTWYLVAGTPKGFRTFRVSRIESAKVLDAECERPANFDLAAHWKLAMEEFIEGRQYEAVLRLEAKTAETLKRWATPSSIREVEGDAPEGWVRRSVLFDDERHAKFVVMGLGAKAEVVAPEKLREEVDADVWVMAQRGRVN